VPRTYKKKELPLEFILKVHGAFIHGADYAEAARILDMSPANLNNQIGRHAQLRLAKEMAMEWKNQKPQTFRDYVFRSLTPEAQKVWDEIQFWEGNTNGPQAVNKILANQTTHMRQELFVHALVMSNYNISEALRTVGTSYTVFQKWSADPEFRLLIEEIGWHKKNFFENALIDLVAMRVPQVVLHANKTVNADRGYGDRVAVDMNAKVETGINLDELDLPLEIKVQVLEAMRNRKEQKQLPAANGEIIEV